MKPSTTNFFVKLAFIGAYPALTFLFTILRLMNVLNLWAAILASVCAYTFGMLLRIKLIEYHPSFISSWTPLFSFIIVSLMASFLAIWEVKEAERYFGLMYFVNMIGSIPILRLLGKGGVITKLGRDKKGRLVGVWFVFILSVAILTSVGLAAFRHISDLFSVIIFGILFGWFGPETLTGKIKPFLLYLCYMPVLGLIYIALETINPSLSYPTLHFAETWMISYIAGYAMLSTRCLLEADKIHSSLIERIGKATWFVDVIRLAEVNKSSFRINKVGWTKSVRYSFLFLKGRMLFLKRRSPSDIDGMSTVTGAVVGGAIGAAIGHVLEKELHDTLVTNDLNKPSLNEISIDELLELDKENFEIYYEDVSKIEMKESKSKFEKAFRTGTLLIEDKKKHKFDIAPNQNFDECVELVRSIFTEIPLKINIS